MITIMIIMIIIVVVRIRILIKMVILMILKIVLKASMEIIIETVIMIKTVVISLICLFMLQVFHTHLISSHYGRQEPLLTRTTTAILNLSLSNHHPEQKRYYTFN